MFAAFSPDSSALAVALEMSESTEPVRVLDPNTMEPTTPLTFPGDEPLNAGDVQFSAEGRHLAATVFPPGEGCCPSGATDPNGFALIWDLLSPASPPVRIGIGTGLQGMALSPDGQTLYTSSPLTAYDVASGTRIWRRPEVDVMLLDVNPRGTLLALAQEGLLVDTADGETVHTLKGHRDAILDIRFSPDGSLVGSVSRDDGLIVWDAATGQSLDRWETFDPYGVGFGPDGLVHGGGADSMLRTWDPTGRDSYLQRTAQVGDSDVFAHADLSPDGQRVAYSWLDDQDRGWVRFVDTLTGDATPPVQVPLDTWKDGFAWSSGAWHPEGREYVTFCSFECTTGRASAWVDPATGRVLRRRDIVDAKVFSMAYVDDGRSLLAGDTDGTTTLVDAETLRPRGEPFDMTANCCITSIGDGSTAMVYEVTSVVGGGINWRVIDVHSGHVLTEGHLDMWAYASVGSPDGSTVAVAGDTGQIVTIEVATGDERGRSTSLGAGVWWLSYSDDGELLVSGSEDGGVSLWDAATLDLLGTVYPPRQGKAVPAGAQFIGDSHDVAIASHDGRVYRWETDLERALDFACQMAGRDLTEEEWAQFLPSHPYQSVCPQPPATLAP